VKCCIFRTSNRAYLGLDKHQVNEQHDEVIFNIFVGKSLATRALRQSHTLALRPVIGATVSTVQVGDWIRAFDADGHRVMTFNVQIVAPLYA
jgi:hypothetical protein